MSERDGAVVCAKALLGRDLSGIEWQEQLHHRVCETLLNAWQVAPFSVPRFLATNGLILTDRYRTRLTHCAAVATAIGRLQRLLMKELFDCLRSHSISAVALKGSATRAVLYDNWLDRVGADIDIAVNFDQLEITKRALTELGYVAAEYNEVTGAFSKGDMKLRSLVENSHYELGFWVQLITLGELTDEELEGFRGDLPDFPFRIKLNGKQAVVPCTVDVHHALSLDIPIEGVMAGRQSVEMPDLSIYVPSMEWIAFFAFFKCYWESGRSYLTGYQNFVDAYRSISIITLEDSEKFVELVERYKLTIGGAFLLRRCRELSIPINSSLERALDRWRVAKKGVSVTDTNDIGDFFPRLFGSY